MSIAPNPLNDISRVYLEQVFESAVPGKPAEKLKTDRNMFSIPKDEQEAARERLKAKTAAKRKAAMEALDPVGQEDADIDNDGDTDSSDKYLHKRRKAIGKAIKKEKMKESFSNWRQDLSEVMDDIEAQKEVKEKKVTNKVKTSAMNGGIKIGEAVEEIGGTLLEMVEIDEVDFVVESVYSDLLDEGYDEDDIEEALEYALVEAKVTFGHDTPTGEKKRGNLVKAVGRLARQKLSSKVRGAKKAASSAVARGARKVAKGALGVARKMEGGKEAPKTAERKPSTYRGAGTGTKERVSSGSYTPPTKKKAEKPADPWEGSATKPPKAKPKVKDRLGSHSKSDEEIFGKPGSLSGIKTPSGEKSKPKAAAPKRKRKSKLDSLLADIRSEEVHQIDELSVNKMLAYTKKAEKDRERLNTKWDKGTATPKERKKVFDREEGEARASDKIKKKTGKRPYEMNTIDRLKAATRSEETQVLEGQLNPGESYMDYAKRREAEKKDNRMTVTAADKKGNTPAYKAYKAGNKRYKAGAGLDEKMNLATADMGDVIKDFQKSDAPQFKGKSKEERRQMAIAAKLTAERGGKRLGEQMDDETGMPPTNTQVDDKKMEQQRKRIQMQKIKDLTVRLAAARKGVY